MAGICKSKRSALSVQQSVKESNEFPGLNIAANCVIQLLAQDVWTDVRRCKRSHGGLQIRHHQGCRKTGTRNIRDAHSQRMRVQFDNVKIVAGDKSGKWNRWYAEAVPRAEQLYESYLKERAEEESGR